MINLKINNIDFTLKNDISILEACQYVGIKVPRFCYYDTLSIAGNCRLCLVRLQNDDKLMISCLTRIEDDMQIVTEDSAIQKAREDILEFLLLNHPLDCPICDQGGECDLQDQARKYGSFFSKFSFDKSTVEDKTFSVFIKTIMTRCISCTRCVRFYSEIAGFDFLGTLNRGGSTEIGSYNKKCIDSEISANVIDLCPVGALTSRPYAFKNRPWELNCVETVDFSDNFGTNIYVNCTETDISRILPKYNSEVNQKIISDRTRFFYDAFSSPNTSTFLIKHKDGYLNKLKENKDVLFFLNQYKLTFDQAHLCLIEDDLNYETINLLKTLSFKNPNLLLRSLNPNKNKKDSNLLINFNNKMDQVSKGIETCILVALNPKIESVLINNRIRFLEQNHYFKIHHLGFKSNLSVNTNFINFTIQDILLLFEGRLNNLSYFLIKKKLPLILFGNLLSDRGLNITQIRNFCKKINPSIIFLNVYSSTSNYSGSLFLNIKSLNSKYIYQAEHVSFLNCKENSLLRKLFSYKKINSLFFWFSTHFSNFIIKNGFDIPIKNGFQENGIFLNIESRPQKAQKILGGITNYIFSLYEFFDCVFLNIKSINKYNFFLKEFSLEPLKFSISSKKNRLEILKNYYNDFTMDYSSISIQPIKSQLNDFYKLNSYTQYSNNMISASNFLIKNYNNFI